jgi:hypothetical protein
MCKPFFNYKQILHCHVILIFLQDLLKQTPNEHPVHSILIEVQVVTQEFLIKVTGGDQKDGAVSHK